MKEAAKKFGKVTPKILAKIIGASIADKGGADLIMPQRLHSP